MGTNNLCCYRQNSLVGGCLIARFLFSFLVDNGEISVFFERFYLTPLVSHREVTGKPKPQPQCHNHPATTALPQPRNRDLVFAVKTLTAKIQCIN